MYNIDSNVLFKIRYPVISDRSGSKELFQFYCYIGVRESISYAIDTYFC